MGNTQTQNPQCRHSLVPVAVKNWNRGWRLQPDSGRTYAAGHIQKGLQYSDIGQQPVYAPHNRTDGLLGMFPIQLTLVYPLATLQWQKLSVSTWSPWPWHIPGSHLAESHPQVAWQSPWLIWASLPRYLHLQLPRTLHFFVVPGPGESYKC